MDPPENRPKKAPNAAVGLSQCRQRTARHQLRSIHRIAVLPGNRPDRVQISQHKNQIPRHTPQRCHHLVEMFLGLACHVVQVIVRQAGAQFGSLELQRPLQQDLRKGPVVLDVQSPGDFGHFCVVFQNDSFPKAAQISPNLRG